MFVVDRAIIWFPAHRPRQRVERIQDLNGRGLSVSVFLASEGIAVNTDEKKIKIVRSSDLIEHYNISQVSAVDVFVHGRARCALKLTVRNPVSPICTFEFAPKSRNPTPAWLQAVPPQQLVCAYDADSAAALCRCHPRLIRFRPVGAKDWNGLPRSVPPARCQRSRMLLVPYCKTPARLGPSPFLSCGNLLGESALSAAGIVGNPPAETTSNTIPGPAAAGRAGLRRRQLQAQLGGQLRQGLARRSRAQPPLPVVLLALPAQPASQASPRQLPSPQLPA